MIYLDERQVGFTTMTLGFPSIDGCHAVVLQTDTGLFGIHCLGGERGPVAKEKDPGWESRAKAFGRFVKGHPQRGKGVHLYSVCFRTGKRGYLEPKLDNWKKEMKAHAKKLGYKGHVSGFDLTTKPNWPGGSAYVEFRLLFGKVHAGYLPWSELTKTSGASTDIPDRFNRQTSSPAGDVKNIEYGKNHTIAATANMGSSGMSIVLDTEWDRFRV